MGNNEEIMEYDTFELDLYGKVMEFAAITFANHHSDSKVFGCGFVTFAKSNAKALSTLRIKSTLAPCGACQQYTFSLFVTYRSVPRFCSLLFLFFS